MSKPKAIKDYDKISEEVLTQIKLEYPYGFDRKLILFKNQKGKLVSALPFETEDRYYLIRMTATQAQEIIEEDNDYNDEGDLTVEANGRLEEELKESEDGLSEEGLAEEFKKSEED